MKSVLGLVLVGVLVHVMCAAGEKPNPNILCLCFAGPNCPAGNKVITHPQQCCQWRCAGPSLTALCPKVQPGQISICQTESCNADTGKGCPYGEVCCKNEGCGGQLCQPISWGNQPCYVGGMPLEAGQTMEHKGFLCRCLGNGDTQCTPL